jgi:hypothetical protein
MLTFLFCLKENLVRGTVCCLCWRAINHCSKWKQRAESTVPPRELVIQVRVPEYYLNRVRWKSREDGNRRNQIKSGIINICSGFKTWDRLLIHDWEPQISPRLFTHRRVLWAFSALANRPMQDAVLQFTAGFAKRPFKCKIRTHLYL